MKLSLCLCLFLVLTQVPSRVESLSLSAVIQHKLQSITKWLDSLADASVFDYIFRVNRGLGLNLFEGDIKGYNPKHQVRTAITNRQHIWTTRVVPYIIDSSFDSASRKYIEAAFDEYHQRTCIRWVPRTNEKDYVYFKQINGCYSNIGRTGGEQDVSLMGACLKKGTAVHEMMHALGFWHEQSRPDRDNFVHVISSNIQDGKEYNFKKLTTAEVDTLGVRYDYGSVMHYSKYAFSKNGNPTIMPTNPPSAQIGQRDGLSDHDVLRIKMLYGCDSKPSQPITTQKPVTKPPETKPPSTKPPATQPPQTNPPATQPPQTNPPATQPPQTNPPVTQPPQTNPPATQPPQTNPPATQPPQTNPPATQPPQTNPPVTQPPQTNPPVTQPPQTNPPVTQPPQTNPPATQPPQTNPPVTQPPQTNPPATQPPQTNPPATQPPQTNPPATQPPQTNPTATQPQQTNPPITNPPQTNPPMTNPPQTLHGWAEWTRWSPCDLQCLHSRYRFCLSYDMTQCPGTNNEIVRCPSPCKPASSLGCWAMSPGSGIPSAEGQIATLSDSYKTRTEAVRKCSDFAAQAGYSIFAIFDGGQCLTGPNAASQFSLLGASAMCDYQGIGSAHAANVYTFERDIDGHWSPWTAFGGCTRTCGIGRQYRYRRCDNPPPVGNGSKCVGHDREEAICNLGTCIAPIKCGNRYYAGRPGASGTIWMREYENFMECEYQIATADPRSTISIFIHRIDIEYSKGCVFDSLMLHDGSNSLAPLVGSFCGTNIPGTFESTSNRVYLKFTSDETQTGGGFVVFYAINSHSRKSCIHPPQSPHAMVTMEGNMVDDRVWYQCEPGFKLVGHSPIICMNQPGFALWNDDFPRCVKPWKRSVPTYGDVRCSFEDSLCGLRNDDDSDIPWTVQRPVYIGTNLTEPDPRGNYFFATSTRLQQPGDTGRARTRMIPASGSSFCLRLLYKIDGSGLARLIVSVQDAVTRDDQSAREDTNRIKEPDASDIEREQQINHGHASGENSRIAIKAKEHIVMDEGGTQDNVWKENSIDFTPSQDFQLVFDAVLGEEIGSSVAIDDVRITAGQCDQL